MSEPLARARRVVAVGVASLAIVLVALAAAAWRLVDAETASAAVRGRSAAALAVEDLVRALASDIDPKAAPVLLSPDGSPVRPVPARQFAPLPSPADAEGAFWIRESEAWSGSLRRAALLRAVSSPDAPTRLAAAAAGVRLALRPDGGGIIAALEWAGRARHAVTFDEVFFDENPLADTRESVLIGLTRRRMDKTGFDISFSAPDARVALTFVGGRDDLEAAALIATLVPDGARLVRERRAQLAEARVLEPAWTVARDVDGTLRAALMSDGSAVAARRADDGWSVVRVTPPVVGTIASRLLDPRGMRLVPADAAMLPIAVPFPGDGPWAVAASFSEDETRSRSTLLLAGLGVAAAAAVAAFGVFARSVRREARLAALRTDFVATVSHELRTPVAVVRTSAETLASGRATRDEDRQALTEAIVRESERLSSLVGNVLDFSRMESGRRTYALLPTDLGALVRDVAARHAGVDVTIADDVPSVACDADALGGAMGNLLDNARKYSSPDAPVAVRVARRDGEVVVEVEDHGIGVPDAEKPHVFERFFRGADARVRETRGAGIGLALVDHAARAHGGRVEVADTAGGGATFRIVFPCAQNG